MTTQQKNTKKRAPAKKTRAAQKSEPNQAQTGLPKSEELRKQMQAVRDAETQACLQAIQLVLAQHGCAITAKPSLSDDGRVTAQISIIKVDQ